MIAYRFAGINQRGRMVRGEFEGELAPFVESCFARRWRELSVEAIATGLEVGGITRFSKRRRVWWAETMLPLEYS